MMTIRNAFRSSILVSCAGFSMAAATSQALAEVPTFEVKIEGQKFVPEHAAIKEGTRVTWTNTSTMIHSVTFDVARAQNPAWVVLPAGVAPTRSVLRPTQTYSLEFPVTGDYKYICEPHQAMGHRGALTVVANTPTSIISRDENGAWSIGPSILHAFVGQAIGIVNTTSEALNVFVGEESIALSAQETASWTGTVAGSIAVRIESAQDTVASQQLNLWDRSQPE